MGLYILEDGILHSRRSENLKSYNFKIIFRYGSRSVGSRY
jgi:hypothetical protein